MIPKVSRKIPKIGMNISALGVALGMVGLSATYMPGNSDTAFAASERISTKAEEIANLINNYRTSQGLAAVPLSQSLTEVAQLNARDLYLNTPAAPCGLLSWSDDSKGSWTPVCYQSVADDAAVQNKAREINAYTGDGFNNVYSSGGDTVTPSTVLNNWKADVASNDLLKTSGSFAGKTWNAMGVGTYKGYATVWFGEVVDPAAGAPVTNTSPTIDSITPNDGDVLEAGVDFALEVEASDTDHPTEGADMVEFYVDGSLIETDTIAPFDYEWFDPAQGIYDMYVRVYDALGDYTESATITFEVNEMPTVAITSPADGSELPLNSDITIKADASDPDGTISQVEFFVDGASVGVDALAAFEYDWANVPEGTYELIAVATDDSGSVVESEPVFITVKSAEAPSVTMTNPVNGGVYNAGEPIQVSVDATDTDGTISKVEIRRSGVLLVEDPAAPYEYNWPAIDVTPGIYNFRAIAEDNDGNRASTPMVTIRVNEFPTVNLTSPADGTTFLPGEIIPLVADATDNDGGIDLVEFFVDGVSAGTDQLAPFDLDWTDTATSGDYEVTVVATDVDGAQTTSTPITVTIAENAEPVVVIVNPVDGAVLTEGESSIITAAAFDPSGITKVEFYNGTTLLGTDVAGPYEYDWVNMAAGDYVLTAKAYDNDGQMATSDPINVTVNKLPAVAITAPSDSQTFQLGSIVTISAEATDMDGNIDTVKFYREGVTSGARALIGEDPVADANNEFVVDWDTTGLVADDYNIIVEAFDNNGDMKEAMITISLGDNLPPEVSVTNISDGDIIQYQDSIIIDVDATDPDGTVEYVEFWIDGNLRDTDEIAPYSYDWVTPVAADRTIEVRAFDNNGAMSSTGIINVKVNAAPGLTIDSPVNDQTFAIDSTVTIEATATDADGNVEKVEFYNGDTLLGTDEVGDADIYRYDWANVPEGEYTIKVISYDNDGSTKEKTVDITVTDANVGPDLVEIIAPVDGTTYEEGDSFVVEANATDSDGNIEKIEFYINDSKVSEDFTSPYTHDVVNAAGGVYELKAVAYDDDGAATASEIVTVNVNQAPTVTITNPINNQAFLLDSIVVVTAQAQDFDGSIDRVEFFRDGVLEDTDIAAPFDFEWDSSIAGAGTYEFYAVAYDDDGLKGRSQTIAITVDTNQGPTVAITAPANGSTFEPGSNIEVTAQSSDPDGSIDRVEFFVNGVALGTDTDGADSYGITLENAPQGSHILTAVAYDNEGAATRSGKVNIIVGASTGPVVVIASPSDGEDFPVGETIVVTANAADPSDIITSVDFYLNGNLVSSDTEYPYTFNIEGAPIGPHIIIADAFNQNGNKATSAPVEITVSDPSQEVDFSEWTDFRGETDNAIDVAEFNNKIYQVHRGLNRKIYTRSSVDGINWSEWRESGGETNEAISMAEFNGRLYQVHRGDDRRIYTRSSADGFNWTNWTQEYGTTDESIDMVAFDGKLYQVHRGDDRHIYTRHSTNGVDWSNWEKFGSGTTDRGIRMTTFNGKIYQTHRGDDRLIYTRSSSDGMSWSNWTQVYGWTDESIDIASYNGALYQSHRGDDRYIYTRFSTNGTDWSPWSRDGSGTTERSIFMDSAIGKLVQTHRGDNTRIYTRYAE
jgi:hypothetical protein